MKNKVLLAGAGYMGMEYAKVLSAMNVDFEVAGRGEKNISALKERFPAVKSFTGGIENISLTEREYTHVIIAAGVEHLSSLANLCLEKGIPNLLVEKPGGLFLHELEMMQTLAAEKKASVFIAFNRRFYRSAEIASGIINADGGISSIHFEFTEWTGTIDVSKYSKETLARWIAANSSHVIDFAFHLGGKPDQLHAVVRGNAVPWHPSGSVFTGSGITVKKIPFSYHANWGAPGRWSVELFTPRHRLCFRPMEKLMVQEKNSVEIKDVPGDYSPDLQYKPGLFSQVKSFLESPSDPRLCNLSEHTENFRFYEKIGGY